MRKLGSTVLALGGLWLARAGYAQDADTLPDLGFLEYLGSWEADDDEWIAIRDWDKDNGKDADADDGDRDDANDDDGGDAKQAPPADRQRNER